MSFISTDKFILF